MIDPVELGVALVSMALAVGAVAFFRILRISGAEARGEGSRVRLGRQSDDESRPASAWWLGSPKLLTRLPRDRRLIVPWVVAWLSVIAVLIAVVSWPWDGLAAFTTAVGPVPAPVPIVIHVVPAIATGCATYVIARAFVSPVLAALAGLTMMTLGELTWLLIGNLV